jgi:hypothetical protein
VNTLKEIKLRFDSWSVLQEQEINGTNKQGQSSSQKKSREDTAANNSAARRGSIMDRDIWLPNTLSDQLDNVVSKVSKVMNYDVGMAMAFAVSILEDNNAHKMAAEVNKLLLKMMEEEE